MHWKILTFVTILMLGTTLMFGVPLALAQETTYIGVYPSSITNVKASDTFAVKINISSTVPFVGYQFYLYWDRTYINATDLTETPPVAWSSFYAGAGLEWDYNATHGRVERAALGVPLVDVTGDFTVATITFNVIKDSPPNMVVPLDLDHENTFLSDASGNMITPYYVYDVDVHLIGEIKVTEPPTSPPSPGNFTTPEPFPPPQIIVPPYVYPITYVTVQPRPVIYLGGETKSPIDALTLMSTIPIWIVLLIVIIIAVVTITLSISLAYLYGMREHDKERAKR